MRRLLPLLMALIFLAGCVSANQPVETATPEVALATETPAPPPTETPLPAKVVLVSDPALDASLSASVQSKLEALTGAGGTPLDVRPTAALADLAPDWSVVVFTAPPPDLDQWLAAAPQTRFIVFSPQELAAAGNLTVIRIPLERLAFTAGFLSTMLAYDFRAGALVPSDDPVGFIWVDAFTNGGRYWCGLCNPYYAPLVRFPLVTYQPRGSNLDAWLAAVDQLNLNIIYVLYVAPEISSPDLLFALASRGYILIGSVTPPDDIRTRWAATLRYDHAAALATAWSAAAGGTDGQAFDAPLVLADVNSQYIAQGRLDLFNRTLAEIESGMVFFLTPPLE